MISKYSVVGLQIMISYIAGQLFSSSFGLYYIWKSARYIHPSFFKSIMKYSKLVQTCIKKKQRAENPYFWQPVTTQFCFKQFYFLNMNYLRSC